MYADDPGAIVILEYQLHNAPSKDYSGDEQKQAAKEQPGSEYDGRRIRRRSPILLHLRCPLPLPLLGAMLKKGELTAPSLFFD